MTERQTELVKAYTRRRQKMSTEQLEAKAIGEMIKKAHCSLLENQHTLDWIVYNCHAVKTLKFAYRKFIRALE